MGELVYEDLNMTREEGNLYYVSFKSGHFQVFKAKMARGRKCAADKEINQHDEKTAE